MVSCAMPKGHPQVLRRNLHPEDMTIEFLDTFAGLIRCRVLPNNQLYHAVLPTKVCGKLLFVNCIECAEIYHRSHDVETGAADYNDVLCDHSDDERSFWSSVTVVELKKALQYGYRILFAFFKK